MGYNGDLAPTAFSYGRDNLDHGRQSVDRLGLSAKKSQLTITALVLLSLLRAPPVVAADCSATGNTYYVDASGGGDGNSGNSPGNAWKTVAKVNASSFNPCDQVLFKRGEMWREQLTVPSSGAAGRPVTFSAYGSGADPVLTGAEIVKDWTLDSGVIYSTSIVPASPGQLGVVVEDGKPLKFLRWNSNVATSFLGANAGSYSYDPVANKIYVWSTDGADPDVHIVEVAVRSFVIRAQTKSYVDFTAITVQHAAYHCIAFDPVDHSNLDNMTVRECGGGYLPAAGDYIGNGIEWAGRSSTYTLTRSILTDNFDSGASPQINSSGDTQTGIRIEDNSFTGNGMFGFEISIPTIQDASAIENVTFVSNIVTDTGRGWSGNRSINGNGDGIRIFTIPASTAEIRNVVISGNTLADNAGAGIRIAWSKGMTTIEKNRIYRNSQHGISVFDDKPITATEARLWYNLVYYNAKSDGGSADYHGLSYFAPNGKGYQIFNNVFYDNGVESFTNGNCMIIEGQSTGTVKNNIFYGGASVAFVALAALTGATVLDYNLYFRDSGNLVFYNGSYYTTADFNAFNAAAGSNEDHGIQTDPLFYAGAGGNFNVSVISPVIDKGTGVGLVADFSGSPVPQGGGVDIGAYEQQLPGSGTLSEVRIHSNPIQPAMGRNVMGFSRLPASASLKVYTLAGELVRELLANASGVASWDGRTRSGGPAASGVYFVLVQAEGQKRILKVAIQR